MAKGLFYIPKSDSISKFKDGATYDLQITEGKPGIYIMEVYHIKNLHTDDPVAVRIPGSRPDLRSPYAFSFKFNSSDPDHYLGFDHQIRPVLKAKSQ